MALTMRCDLVLTVLDEAWEVGAVAATCELLDETSWAGCAVDLGSAGTKWSAALAAGGVRASVDDVERGVRSVAATSSVVAGEGHRGVEYGLGDCSRGDSGAFLATGTRLALVQVLKPSCMAWLLPFCSTEASWFTKRCLNILAEHILLFSASAEMMLMTCWASLPIAP